MSQAAASAAGALPPVICEYLAAADRGAAEAVVRCFARDAVVVDEGREWRGTAPIRRWRGTVATAYQYTVQVTAAEARGEADVAERHDVHIHLEGNFPGGQVDLTDRFALRDGRIASLEIVPTEATRGARRARVCGWDRSGPGSTPCTATTPGQASRSRPSRRGFPRCGWGS